MKKFLISILAICLFFVLTSESGCETAKPKSNSDVSQVNADVPLNANGHTIEQENIKKRYHDDNMPGAIKHLYIISAYSGQVLVYSTVKGKVTSSGKRLSPTTYAVSGYSQEYYSDVMQDDGTYGSSVEYIYWWDTKGVYHQQYITGGMILHISSQPISVKSVIINMENTGTE